MSMMPEPPSDWKAVELKFVPKSPDGVPSTADLPLTYYVDSEKGNGVAFPARYHNDKGPLGSRVFRGVTRNSATLTLEPRIYRSGPGQIGRNR